KRPGFVSRAFSLRFRFRSERELGGDLQGARTTAAKQGIPSSDIAGDTECERATCAADRDSRADRRVAGAYLANAVAIGDGFEVWQQWIAKVRVVEEVVGLEAQLEFEPFGDVSLLEDREIELPEIGTDERIPAEIAEVAAAWDAGRSCSVECSGRRAGHRK